jgi:hypothetical protein
MSPNEPTNSGASAEFAAELEHPGLACKNMVALHVADTGTGIPEAVKERMFEPFFTTKGNRGSGLGLASVKESVEACGGAVKVDSKLGQGTTLTLFLPTTVADQADHERTNEVAVNPGAILVVEEPLVLAAIVRALQSHGFVARGATSAAHGNDILRSGPEPISLLVVGDVNGPDFGELACSLRHRSADARIICCVDESIDEEDIKMPVTCLFKPFTLPELLKIVERELAMVAKTAAQPAREIPG